MNPNYEAVAETITIDEFATLDIRIGAVLNCQAVEGSDKLLQLTVDLGFEQRNILSGIKGSYSEPNKLIGRKVIVVANLAARKMRFGVSQGMVLCASNNNSENHQLFLLDVDEGALPGMRVT